MRGPLPESAGSAGAVRPAAGGSGQALPATIAAVRPATGPGCHGARRSGV